MNPILAKPTTTTFDGVPYVTIYQYQALLSAYDTLQGKKWDLEDEIDNLHRKVMRKED